MKMRNKDYETIVKLLEQNNELLEFLNNKVTLASQRLIPWFDKRNITISNNLRDFNPEIYDFVIEILTLFFE